MHNFYRNYLSPEEHHRIDTLEPFDETEEWQSKCVHYILLFGLKTSSDTSRRWFEQMTRDFSTIISLRKEDLLANPNAFIEQASVNSNLQFEPYPTIMTYAQRFGHQSILINEKYIWTIGGFGTVDGRHRRLKTIEVLNIENGDIQRLDNHALGKNTNDLRIECITLQNCLGECVFHTCHGLDNLILIFFGRKSPGILNACTSMDIQSKRVEVLMDRKEASLSQH